MSAALTREKEVSPGHKAMELRISEHLTRQKLAARVGVSSNDMGASKRGLPLPLESRRRILRELWARKILRTANGRASKAQS